MFGVVPEQVKRRLPQENLASQGQGEEEHTDLQNDKNNGEENEVALEATCSFLDARTRELETNTYPALNELTSMVFSFFLSLDLFIAARLCFQIFHLKLIVDFDATYNIDIGSKCSIVPFAKSALLMIVITFYGGA
ncbi:hypothetical protein GQ457_12G015490 [Hibiscus cannabinus]